MLGRLWNTFTDFAGRRRIAAIIGGALVIWVAVGTVAGAVHSIKAYRRKSTENDSMRAPFRECERQKAAIAQFGATPAVIGFIGDVASYDRRTEILRAQFVFSPTMIRPNADAEWNLILAADLDLFLRDHAATYRLVDRGSTVALIRREHP